MKNKSLYVHIPFCDSICSYCDFIKVYKNDAIIEKYLTVLKKELDSFKIKELKTIYVGGGTPSSLNEKQLETLLEMFKDIKLEKEYEFSFEANPESLTLNKIKLLKKYGVNRISLGVQTFDSKLTKLLNRKHDYEMVKEVVKNLNDVGIFNYSFDFIYALPFQTKDNLKKDLDLALSLKPKHLSFYSLSIEENTLLYIRNYRTLDSALQREYYDFIYDFLNNNHFKRYEISSFALEDKYQSIHNKTYWNNENYYAIGVSASGYLNDQRYTNTKSLTKYLDMKNDKETELIDSYNNFIEQIMLNLRLDEGLNIDLINQKFKIDFLTKYQDNIQNLLNRKLIMIENNRLKTTYEGSLLLHQVIEEFME